MSGFSDRGEGGTHEEPKDGDMQKEEKSDNEPKTIYGGFGSTPRPNRPKSGWGA